MKLSNKMLFVQYFFGNSLLPRTLCDTCKVQLQFIIGKKAVFLSTQNYRKSKRDYRPVSVRTLNFSSSY